MRVRVRVQVPREYPWSGHMTQERMRKIEAEAPAAAARGDWESVAHLISDSAARRPPNAGVAARTPKPTCCPEPS